MRCCCDRTPRGEDEGLQRWHHPIQTVYLPLYLGHGALGDGSDGMELVLSRIGGEVAPDGEELVLEPVEELLIGLLELMR